MLGFISSSIIFVLNQLLLDSLAFIPIFLPNPSLSTTHDLSQPSTQKYSSNRHQSFSPIPSLLHPSVGMLIPQIVIPPSLTNDIPFVIQLGHIAPASLLFGLSMSNIYLMFTREKVIAILAILIPSEPKT